jgi:energy-coupling factor transporter ATP-binding protein EcfA2
MYLKSILLENVGPIPSLDLQLPFEKELPLPVVLVGPNGSGKSTLLSFVVNALIGFKQQVYDEAEVEQNRVYRVRAPMFIRGGCNWYHAKLDFCDGLSLEEWVLDRPRSEFEKSITPLPLKEGWKQIKEEERDQFSLTPQPPINLGGARERSAKLEKLFAENVVLYFPSDRFELPDWLNESGLLPDLRFPEPMTFKGQTHRRIFARALLRPTLQWLKAVVLDSRLADYAPFDFVTDMGVTTAGLVHRPGKDSVILDTVAMILARILGADDDSVRLHFGNRNQGLISVRFSQAGVERFVPSLLGLSAGQAALFCLFCNIIRDFDLAGTRFNQPSDIRGIVVIDEADHHLHVELQYQLLPELVKLFPKVQFITTAHAPLFVMGMEQTFGSTGFQIVELPTGNLIDAERFTEFENALTAFSKTRSFHQRLLDRIQQAAKPVVVVEGKNDVTHIQTAWEKLNPGMPLPWDVVKCGGLGTQRDGGAKMLKTMIEACCLHIERHALALFDHDTEGVAQFRGLKSAGFDSVSDVLHLRHSQRPVHALLLPVPDYREDFTSSEARSCWLGIEHYYSDSVLQRFGIADGPVAKGSTVFAIASDSAKKTAFAKDVQSLSADEFTNFKLLFDRLSQVLAVESETLTVAAPTDFALRIDCGVETVGGPNIAQLDSTELTAIHDTATVDGHERPEFDSDAQ